MDDTAHRPQPEAAIVATERASPSLLRYGPVLLLVVGAGLRLWRLSRQSFWYDEAVSAELGRHGVWELATGAARDLGNPPLHPILLHLWSRLFGAGDGALRSLSAVAGALSIPLLFHVGRRLVGERAALVAAALLALSPFQVYLGQETRTYALVTLLVLAAFESLLRALERPADARWWVAYGATTFLALYAHYYALFTVAAQLLFVLAYERRREVLAPMGAALAAAALLYGSWLPSLYGQAASQGNLGRSAETWFLHALATPLVFGVGTTLVWKALVSPVRLALAAASLLALVGTALVGAGWLRRERRALLLLVLWLGLPILVPVAISALLFPFYTVRYPLVASPAYYLLIAAGLCALRPAVRAGAVAVLAAGALVSLHTYYSTAVKHEWRSAAAFVDGNAAADDLLLFDADFNERSFAHYARGPQPHLRLVPAPAGAFDRLFAAARAGDPVHDVTDEIGRRARVWLIVADGDRALDAQCARLLGGGRRQTTHREWRGIDARRFERP